MTKPPLPEKPWDPFPRVQVDQTEGAFALLLRIGVFAADLWAMGPEGDRPQTRAEMTRGLVREALLHLLELGAIDIDTERLDALAAHGFPPGREAVSGEGEDR